MAIITANEQDCRILTGKDRSPEVIRVPRETVRESLPEVTLINQNGQRVSLRELKRIKQAAIFFFHGGDCAVCREKLRGFAGAADRYAEIPAAVIAVSLDARTDLVGLARELKIEFTLAHDPGGKLIGHFAPADPQTGERTPCCVVADAFGEIFTVLRGEDAVEQSEILNWMDFIDVQCPE